MKQFWRDWSKDGMLERDMSYKNKHKMHNKDDVINNLDELIEAYTSEYI